MPRSRSRRRIRRMRSSAAASSRRDTRGHTASGTAATMGSQCVVTWYVLLNFVWSLFDISPSDKSQSEGGEGGRLRCDCSILQETPELVDAPRTHRQLCDIDACMKRMTNENLPNTMTRRYRKTLDSVSQTTRGASLWTVVIRPVPGSLRHSALTHKSKA